MALDVTDHGPFYVGVDVGTGSARAALVSRRGRVLSTASRALQMLEPRPDYYEQASDDVWETCCGVVKMVTQGVNKAEIHGIGFDATCSLVVLDKTCQPLSISPTDEKHWNIIMWLDHRAAEQARAINATKHECLNYVGGTISSEMQMPKLLWLKQNMTSEFWQKAGHFFDLADFLTWKATGSLSRSLCSLVSKWNYQASSEGNLGWSSSFLADIGLEVLAKDDYSMIGREVLSPGMPCAGGLTAKAAAELGLEPGTAVASSLIDAHAGALGCLACTPSEMDPVPPITSKLAIICGTSTCHVAVSSSAKFVAGVWGPYYSVLLPDLWLNEGGQSATGKLLDHIVEQHAMYGWLKAEADKRDVHVHTVLNEILTRAAKENGLASVDLLTRDLHMWPDFHGNRSPLADQSLKGMVSGLNLDSGVEALAHLYLATIQALAYGTRHILESFQGEGHLVEWLYACGGLSKNTLLMQTHADVTGLPVVLPDEKESVLLGSAILGACASQDFPSLQAAISKMGGAGTIQRPNPHVAEYHGRKYEVYMKMVEHQRLYRTIMGL